jgi:hypothetical protein
MAKLFGNKNHWFDTWYCTNKWTIIRYTSGRHSIFSLVRHARHDTTPLNRMCPWDGVLGLDTATNGSDTTSRFQVHSKWLALNAIFPFLAPKTTASNNVDPSPLCLVQNGRAAATDTNGLHRLYATLTMEGTRIYRTSEISGELPQRTRRAMDYQNYKKDPPEKTPECLRTPPPPHMTGTLNTPTLILQ